MVDSYQKIRFEVLKGLLLPIARFCIRRSHSFQDMVAAAKDVFLQAAEEEMRRSGQKVNISRLAVMTGLHRDEVSRLYKGKKSAEDSQKSILTRVIGQWRHDPRFTTKAGEPRVLSWSGEGSEFDQLVCSVSKNLYSGTVLKELKRLKLVEESPRGLKLATQMLSFSSDPRGGFNLLSEDLDSLINAAEENLLEELPVTNLHVRTVYDNVIKSALPEIRKWFLREGRAFHKKARTYLSQFDKDINPELENQQGGGKVVLSAFSHTIEPEEGS